MSPAKITAAVRRALGLTVDPPSERYVIATGFGRC